MPQSSKCRLARAYSPPRMLPVRLPPAESLHRWKPVYRRPNRLVTGPYRGESCVVERHLVSAGLLSLQRALMDSAGSSLKLAGRLPNLPSIRVRWVMPSGVIVCLLMANQGSLPATGQSRTCQWPPGRKRAQAETTWPCLFGYLRANCAHAAQLTGTPSCDRQHSFWKTLDWAAIQVLSLMFFNCLLLRDSRIFASYWAAAALAALEVVYRDLAKSPRRF